MSQTASATPIFERKICAPADLAARVAELPRPLVFTNGCFDILHRGHVAYLAQARSWCDRLVVALNTDASVRRLKGEGRPINDLDSRAACEHAPRLDRSPDAGVFGRGQETRGGGQEPREPALPMESVGDAAEVRQDIRPLHGANGIPPLPQRRPILITQRRERAGQLRSP